MGAGAEIGFLVAGTIIKAEATKSKAEFEKAQLERRRQEERAKANLQALQQDQKLRTILGEQVAHEAAAGLTAGSLAPITQDTFQKFAQDRDAIQLNLKYQEQALDLEEDQIDSEKNWAMIGNLFDLGNGLYKAKSLSDTGQLQSPSTGQIKTTNVSSGLKDLDNYNRQFVLKMPKKEKGGFLS